MLSGTKSPTNPRAVGLRRCNVPSLTPIAPQQDENLRIIEDDAGLRGIRRQVSPLRFWIMVLLELFDTKGCQMKDGIAKVSTVD
jgi:hypothetical protein